MSTKVSIKPYISGLPNGGLEKEGMVVADGAQHKDLLGLVERNGIKCYLTGLNELAPEVQGIKDPEQKEAVIRDIRKTVVFLENSLAGNFSLTEHDIDEYDTDGKATGKFSDKFWDKVTMFVSQGPDKLDDKRQRIPTYWDSVEIKCGNEPITLDHKNPHDLILIKAIEAKGFDIVAPSLQAARESVHPPKWYLDRDDETAGIEVEGTRLEFTAGAELMNMVEKDVIKLLYVTKVCAINSLSYRKATPVNVLLRDCTKFIKGETVDKNKKLCAQKFINASKLDLAELRVQAIVRDATEMHMLTYKQDGQLYYNKTGTPMGKGLNDVIQFLKNPLNTDVLTDVSDEVEAEWIK